MPTSIQTFERAADFETLIAELSSRFINLPAGEVDQEIEGVLRRVCEWFGIDLAVLWQWSIASPDIIVPTHSHYAEEGRQPPVPLDQHQFPWYAQQMRSGKLIAIASLDDLPAEAAVDREHGVLFGVQSNLCLPLALGGAPPVGALALNTLRHRRDWPSIVVKRLQLVAQIITNALARKRSDQALRESEERLVLAVNAAAAGLWTLDPTTGVFWASPQARAMFGYAPDEIIDMPRFEASVRPEDWPSVREAIEGSLRGGKAIDVEYRIRVPGKADVTWIASRGGPSVVSSAQGCHLMGISLHISERRRLEEQLRANEARLAAGADLAGLAFYQVDFRAGVVHLDDRCRDLLGIDSAAAHDLEPLRLWMDRLHPEDRPRVLHQRELLHAGARQPLAIEYRYLHPVRGEIWIDHLARVAERDADGRTWRSYGVLRDIGRKKRTELALHHMSQRLLQAQEQERALIARELHDDLSQRLAVLAIDVGRAEGAGADAGLNATLRAVREQLVRVSEDVHALAYQLHPSVLDELGLAEALRAECERRGRQNRLEVTVSIDPLADDLGNEAALCLFRVAQEALRNVVRHAGAGQASVQLRPHDGGLLLAVQDDGGGFDPRQLEGGRHLGLASMRERMRIVQGTLDIDTVPGSGTTVLAWVPVGRAPESAQREDGS